MVKDQQENSSAKYYSQRLASGSFWNFTNFLVTGVIGFISSIFLARYLHADTFGQYSFIVTIVAVASLFLDFGFGQVFARYVPKYFHDNQNKKVVIRLFWQVIVFELIVVTAIGLIAWINRDQVGAYLPTANKLTDVLLLTSLIAILAAAISRQITSFLSSAHQFKKMALATMSAQVLSIIAILIIGKLGNISLFFYLPMISALVLLSTLSLNMGGVLSVTSSTTTKSINKNELIGYALISYIGLVIQFVIWSYSEVFILKHYSTFKDVGYYTLAFSLSGILAAIPPLFYKPITNIQFELLERGEIETVDKLTFFTMKYSSIIFLPLSLVASYLMYDLIQMVYGYEYLTVAYLFPMCLFGSILTASFLPITIRMINDNKKYSRIIVLTAIVAVINILLGLLFIPRYAAIGAGIANILTQIIIVLSTVIYTSSQLDMKINWSVLGKILAANIIIGLGLIGLVTSVSLLIKLFVVAIALLIYLILLKGFRVFDQQDTYALGLLGENLPFQRLFNPVKKIIKFLTN